MISTGLFLEASVFLCWTWLYSSESYVAGLYSFIYLLGKNRSRNH